MTNSTLGIMTVYAPTQPPFPERAFFKTLIEAGKREGIAVIVFHPDQINFLTRTVKGYHLNEAGRWVATTAPLPSYIYDRCFYTGKRYNQKFKPAVAKLLQDKSIRFLGIGLKGKWQMYNTVSQHSKLRHLLPPTEVYASSEQLKQWLQRYPSVVLKPVNGSLGIGVLKVSRVDQSIEVEGRGKTNAVLRKTFPSINGFASFFDAYVQKWRYLIQPYLTLRTNDDIPFDIRLLVQKNETGQWTTTGKAIRIGSKGSITSNLHGGGKAFSFERFMNKNYPQTAIETITNQLQIAETILPSYLDQKLGPLVELGIDIGIDQDHKVWLIEVNSKPGREIFEQLHEKEAILNSQLNPLYYAKFLMQSDGRMWQPLSRSAKARRRRKRNRQP